MYGESKPRCGNEFEQWTDVNQLQKRPCSLPWHGLHADATLLPCRSLAVFGSKLAQSIPCCALPLNEGITLFRCRLKYGKNLLQEHGVGPFCFILHVSFQLDYID